MSQSNLIQVAKLGGSCLADMDAMRLCAQKIAQIKSPVIVVSAMKGHTDKLTKLCHDAAFSDSSEYAAILATGEQVSAALFALMLQKEGRMAQSLQGWQLHMDSEGDPLIAHPKNIDKNKLLGLIDAGVIPVICGYQGIAHGRTTVFGRGGSDTSAIFVAASLGLSECTLYKDVAGIYVADPALIKQKVVKKDMSYAEMAEASSRGCKVLDARAVDEARRHQIQIKIRNIFSDQEGTVVHEKRSSSSSRVIAHVGDQQLIRMQTSCLEDVAKWLSQLESSGVMPRVIAFDQNGGEFFWRIAVQSKVEINNWPDGIISHEVVSGLVAVSVVGWSVRHASHSLISILSNLNQNDIECHDFSLSDMSVTFWVNASKTELVIRALHQNSVKSDNLISL